MKIPQYMDCLNTADQATSIDIGFSERILSATDVWSELACRGYCKLAMKAAGCDPETISRVLSQFNFLFDEVSVEEAEQSGLDQSDHGLMNE